MILSRTWEGEGGREGGREGEREKESAGRGVRLWAGRQTRQVKNGVSVCFVFFRENGRLFCFSAFSARPSPKQYLAYYVVRTFLYSLA